MERGTKRNQVQWSFVPWLKVLSFASSAAPDEHQTCERNCKEKPSRALSLNCRTATSTKGSLVITPSKVVIWGSSAGGVGADCNLLKFRLAWSATSMWELSNGGPPTVRTTSCPCGLALD